MALFTIASSLAAWRKRDKLHARDAQMLTSVIARCCQIKAEVVGADETEGSMRAILNFGHTIGHGLKRFCRYGKYLHGEAISIAVAARSSRKKSQGSD
jgi:3-dehydroquinate synthase